MSNYFLYINLFNHVPPATWQIIFTFPIDSPLPEWHFLLRGLPWFHEGIMIKNINVWLMQILLVKYIEFLY